MSKKKQRFIDSKPVQLFIMVLDGFKGITLWLLEWICFIATGVLVVAAVAFILEGQPYDGLIAAASALLLVLLCMLLSLNQDKQFG